MSKLNDMAQAKAAEVAAKQQRVLGSAPSMSSYISRAGSSGEALDGQMNALRAQASASFRPRGPQSVASFAGGGTVDTTSSVHEGSMAGMRNEKSAYIGLNGTNYDSPSLIPNTPPRRAISAASEYVQMNPKMLTRNVADYRKVTTSGAKLLASHFT